MKFLVAGGREFGCFEKNGKLFVDKKQRNFIYDILTAACGFDKHGEPLPAAIVHGDCPTGADRVTRAFCDRNMLIQKPYPAKWKAYGKAAGPMRNQKMIDENPDIEFMIAFPGSAGTNDMSIRAEKAGIPVFEASYGRSKSY